MEGEEKRLKPDPSTWKLSPQHAEQLNEHIQSNKDKPTNNKTIILSSKIILRKNWFGMPDIDEEKEKK